MNNFKKMSLKEEVISLSKNRFDKINKIIDVYESQIECAWLEVHTARKGSCTLNEFIVNSLRFVKFWEYETFDKMEFENDVQTGKYIEIDKKEAFHKMEFIRSSLKNIQNKEIPKDIQDLVRFKTIILMYDEWNNRSITFVSDTHYKSIYFGTSE